MKAIKVTDGYKVYHTEQYPQEVLSMYGNLTPRGDKYFQRVFDKDMIMMSFIINIINRS